LSSTSKQVTPVPAGLVGQAIAGLGAVLCLLFAFGIALPAAGIACLILGVIIASPHGRHPGPYMTDWWTVLAISALVCLVGFAFQYVSEVPGNILLALGAVAALVAIALGTPPDDA